MRVGHGPEPGPDTAIFGRHDDAVTEEYEVRERLSVVELACLVVDGLHGHHGHGQDLGHVLERHKGVHSRLLLLLVRQRGCCRPAGAGLGCGLVAHS